ncbi:histidine kinase [Dissulfurispira thermophila]|uniref:histidine kinase n=2 Tax=root TaxID=1 RepID=A0A7G1H6A6_9BACT|nr:ATP-binding protein [Dissulfurispira thermophila]BCB97277.1 histidine kinase [Dissulfurispira thermophila]
MEDISLHILDIAENSIDAGAKRVEIRVIINEANDRFILKIIDDGKGMDENTIKMVNDPFFSTKAVRRKKFGLGIPLLAQATNECNGNFSVESEQGKGTVITAEFQHSHIDMKPLGDIGATMAVLIGGHPEIDFLFSFKKNDFYYKLETEELKRELGDVPINLPDVLNLIREDINSALKGEN